MKSMTGYGMGEELSEGFSCKIEIKSVNNRFCDITVRIPKALNPLEEAVRKEIKKVVSRGKIDVFISYQASSMNSTSLFTDRFLAEQYIGEFRKMKESFGLCGDIDVNTLAQLPGVFQVFGESLEIDEISNPFLSALSKALEEFIAMRQREGEHLERDLKEKLESLKPHVDFLKENSERLLQDNLKAFQERFHKLRNGEEFDLPRLTSEIAIMADKLSIDEEITRITSHIAQFNDIMMRNDPIGRKLDFLLQELNREVNTIGSKTNDTPVINHVVEMKSIIEQLREQVQNIE